MLGMNVYKAGGDGRKVVLAYRLVANKATGTAGSGHYPSYYYIASVPRQVKTGKNRLQGGIPTAVELALHHAGVGQRAYRRGVGLATCQKRYRSQQNGLTGSGFSRNNDQTRRKRYFQRVYQYKILNL